MGRVGRRFAHVALLAGLLYITQYSAAGSLDGAPNRKEIEAKITSAREEAKRRGGNVVVGRIVLDGPGDPQDVNAQMEILPGGYFAGPVRNLRGPIGFRLHQFAPVDFELEGLSGEIVDLGIIHMAHLGAESRVALAGRLLLEDGGNPATATLELSPAHGPINTPSGGTSPRRHFAAPVKVAVQADGTISAGGFSPMTYTCRITAPGFVDQLTRVSFAPGEPKNLGEITLERPLQITLDYIVAKEPPFELLKARHSVVSPGEGWKATSDIQGTDLKFDQRSGGAVLGSSYGPCLVKDLGAGKLVDFTQTAGQANPTTQPNNFEIQSGHVYVVNQGFWKRWILMRVEIAEPQAEFHQWKDSSGGFQVDARFVGMKDNVVQLKKRDGSMIAVPLEKLNDEDRRYATLKSVPRRTTIEPNPAVAGSTARVWYRQNPGPLASAKQMVLHWGVNGGLKAGDSTWQNVVDTPMTAALPGVWYLDVPVPAGATSLNFVVNDGNDHWDNNGSADWNFAVVAK